MVEIGKKVDNFKLFDDQGNIIELNSFIGKKVIIYFYPKDSTPGCTRQACVFKSTFNEFVDNNAIIIGISKDSIKSHANFKQKNNLPFILLSDPELSVIKYFGAYGEKKNYGKTYLGIIRSTFVLDESHIIKKIYKPAKPDTNAIDVLNFLKENA